MKMTVIFLVFLFHVAFAHTDEWYTTRSTCMSDRCTNQNISDSRWKETVTTKYTMKQVADPAALCFFAWAPCHGHKTTPSLYSRSYNCTCSGPYLMAPTTSSSLTCPVDVLQFETQFHEQRSKKLLVTFFDELLRRSYASALYIVKDMIHF
jgi:hypothetical protein